MRKLGTVSNKNFDGGSCIFCDGQLRFGGWDLHEDDIVNEKVQLEIEGQRACLFGGGEGQTLHVFENDSGVLFATAPEDGGVSPEDISLPLTETSEVGVIDLPNGELVIALAYPPLNMQTDGDFAGVEHGEGEILRVPGGHKQLRVSMEHTGSGWRLQLSP